MSSFVGIMGTAAIYLVVYVKRKNAKKYRKDVEYGSARWSTPADVKPFVRPAYDAEADAAYNNMKNELRAAIDRRA